jgi:hypothetical protein
MDAQPHLSFRCGTGDALPHRRWGLRHRCDTQYQWGIWLG